MASSLKFRETAHFRAPRFGFEHYHLPSATPLPALTDEQLGGLMLRGRSAEKHLRRIPGLPGASGGDGSLQERAKLLESEVMAAAKAKEELVLRGIPLAFHLTSLPSVRWLAMHAGFDLEDIFQTAMLGVMRAADKFDPAIASSFSNYASWWARHMVVRELRRSRFIRIQFNSDLWLRSYERAKAFMEKGDLGRDSVKAFRKEYKTAGRILESMLSEKGRNEMEAERSRLLRLREETQVELALDAPPPNLPDCTLGELCGEGSEEETVEHVNGRQIARSLMRAKLRREDRQVIRSVYYGEHSLSDVSRESGVSKETACNRHDRGIVVMREYARARGLSGEYGPTLPGTEHIISESRAREMNLDRASLSNQPAAQEVA